MSDKSNSQGRATMPAVYMRGGTSKGVFLHERDVPPPGAERDRLLLDIMGSPDPMQIDGMGGTVSSTSKVVIVAKSDDPDIDVRYLFAQIGVDKPIVDWSGNCGNLTTAVAPFAIDEGLVDATEPLTTLRLLNENTGVVIEASTPVENGRAVVTGDVWVSGVPTPGAPVITNYLDPAGGVLGKALPTGSPLDLITAGGEEFPVSVVDVTHPYVFVDAASFGLDISNATSAELNKDQGLLERLEELRGRCAVNVGAVGKWEDAMEHAAIIPRLVLVASPTADDDDADILAVGVSMGKIHHALQMTAAYCLPAAAAIPGSVVAKASGGDFNGQLRIRHPKGVVLVTADVDTTGPETVVRSVGAIRTARRLMDGTLYVREP